MSGGWVLCVDDEPRVLDGLELHLGMDHDVRLAGSGPEGLALLRGDADCAVIISDMRMPHMDGAEFLAAAREVAPDATRVLLTGYSEMSAAVSAVNEGGIHRFLTKPVAPPVVLQAVRDGMRQFELIRSERVLLEQTLHGAADALIQALEIATPEAFSRCRSIEAACRHVAELLGLTPVWEVALAGLLVRLGWIAVPSATLGRYLGGQDLDEVDRSMLDASYATGAELVERIPRLGAVAGILRCAREPSAGLDAATVVRAATDLDRARGIQVGQAGALADLAGRYPAAIIDALVAWHGDPRPAEVREARVHELRPGMVTESDVLTDTGNLLIRAGTELTVPLVDRLCNFARAPGLRQPIVVSVPSR